MAYVVCSVTLSFNLLSSRRTSKKKRRKGKRGREKKREKKDVNRAMRAGNGRKVKSASAIHLAIFLLSLFLSLFYIDC
jgi:hypothetical protein